jgi:hypothetical protein
MEGTASQEGLETSPVVLNLQEDDEPIRREKEYFESL